MTREIPEKLKNLEAYVNDKGSLISFPFLVSYPKVFKPDYTSLDKDKQTDENKAYSLTMVYPKSTDLTLLKKIITEAAVEKFGEKKSFIKPFLDGDLKDDELRKDCFYTHIRSKQKPSVVKALWQDEEDDNNITIIGNKELESSEPGPDGFYPGCWARALINPYATDFNGSRRVNFGLVHVQKLLDDEPLSGSRPSVDDAFGSVVDSDTIEDDPFATE